MTERNRIRLTFGLRFLKFILSEVPGQGNSGDAVSCPISFHFLPGPRHRVRTLGS